jgi:hypothetical protein
MPIYFVGITIQTFYERDFPSLYKDTFRVLETKLIIEIIVYFVLFMISLFFTIKKKYVFNIFLFGSFVLFFTIKALFFFNG